MYTIDISDRKYTEWKITTKEIIEETQDDIQIQPFSQKLFHKDVFSKNHQIIQSPTRNAKYIAGILILENNRTYGRTPNKKKLYYSCIPYQKQLPIFLVPYEIQMGFHKNIQNKFVLFKFDHWIDKHPCGILIETIGDVNHLPHYYEYQLYAKNIHLSPIVTKSNKKIKTYLQTKPLDTYIQEILQTPTEYGNIVYETKKYSKIFTIDPIGCVDKDDALSICIADETNPSIFNIQVHIANVWLWIKAFDLWELLDNTAVSTIYLPDFNRHMLPSELSEKICSLDEKQYRFTFTMEFQVDIIQKTIIPIYTPEIITQKYIFVSKNFDYDSESLLKYSPYLLLLQTTREIKPEIKDSHELVAFWMMQMNMCIAKEMYLKKTGIFRITNSSSPLVSTPLVSTPLVTTPLVTSPLVSTPLVTTPLVTDNSFLYIWEHAISGKYEQYNYDQMYYHQILNVNHYMHFTSPIRRKVDIYNQLYWMRMMNMNMNIPTIITIDEINENTKKIRKIQNECTLLHMLQSKENIITDGFVLQIINETKSLVYLPIYKCILSCKCCLELYTNIRCKIYVFERESDYKRKIQITIL